MRNCTLAVMVLSFLVTGVVAEEKSEGEPSSLEIFDQRIVPIFKSPKPSSCVQCHLAAVDLKNYIHASAEKTFASLRDQGLIDLDQPEKSKILTLIKMGEKDLDKGAKLIHAKTRLAEYKAFSAWIKACSADPKMRNLPKSSLEELAKPDKPDEVIRHMRKSRVVDSFVRNIWSQRMRCFPCHTPHEIENAGPRQQASLKTLRQLKLKYSKDVLSRIDIFQKTPEETLAYLIEMSKKAKSGETPLLNLKDPRNSLLVLKPTSRLPPKNKDGKIKIPPAGGPMYHLGGLKMHRDDQSYKSFITWIQDYARVVKGEYAAVEDLPADNWHPSKLILRLTYAPETWQTGTPVQLFVHAFNEEKNAFEKEAVAFTQGTVTPRHMVNGALFMLGSKGSKWDPESAKLERGRYLVKVYLDSERRLAKDPTLLLGKAEYQGGAEIASARWREGFRQAETVAGGELEK